MSTQNHANDGSMLLAWGSNKDSQVSDNDDEDARARKAVFGPTPLVESERFLAVAAGEGHSLYVSDTGDVFSSGRGTEGQLGTGKKAVLHKPEPIEALADVVVVGIAAGSHHSIACTAAGRVFMWGLITVDQEDPLAKNQPPPPPGPPSSGGDGTGDGWNSTGGDAGATAQAATGGDARTMLGLTGQTNEVLRRIVRESERRWLTAEEDQATGSTAGQTASGGATGATEEEKKEEALAEARAFKGESAASERNAAGDGGMGSRLDMHAAQRRPVLLPRLADTRGLLKHKRVCAVSAGFGHSLVLTDSGLVFSVGYNDRGQLGLGHRMNSSIFQPVTALEPFTVVQIACGSQHNLCRALRRRRRRRRDGVNDHSDDGGDDGACEMFVWGNGSLGQLGLGMRVTGRRSPVQLHLPPPPSSSSSSSSSAATRPCYNVIFVAAGANHSVCVCGDSGSSSSGSSGSSSGRGVFSWGHGEYGQHGGAGRQGSSFMVAAATAVSTHDLVDPFYYYSPRLVLEAAADEGSSGEGDPFVGAACGACFTLAYTLGGEVWSWGWNAFGVLGRGGGGGLNNTGVVSMNPERVGGVLGPRSDRRVVSVACGANHALCLARTTSAPRAALLRPLLRRAFLAASSSSPASTSFNSSSLSSVAATATMVRTAGSPDWMLQLKKELKSSTPTPPSSSFLAKGGDPASVATRRGVNGGNVIVGGRLHDRLGKDASSGGVGGDVVDNAVKEDGGESEDEYDDDQCDVLLTFSVQEKQRRRAFALPAHRVVLEARCPYLRGLISAAFKQAQGQGEGETAAATSVPGSEEHKEQEKKEEGAAKQTGLVKVALLLGAHDSCLTPTTLKSLLLYLYCDRLESPPHTVRSLRVLAKGLFLDRLEALCSASLGEEYGGGGGGGSTIDLIQAFPSSTFELDLDRAAVVATSSHSSSSSSSSNGGGGRNEASTADVRLVVAAPPTFTAAAVHGGYHGGASGGGDDKYGNVGGDNGDGESKGTQEIRAHRVLLERVPFFKTLLSGRFKEGCGAACHKGVGSGGGGSGVGGQADTVAPCSIATLPPPSSSPSPSLLQTVDVSGLVSDGCSVATLTRLVRFVYSGNKGAVPLNDPNAVTELAAFAERLGVQDLVKVCERALVDFVARPDPDHGKQHLKKEVQQRVRGLSDDDDDDDEVDKDGEVDEKDGDEVDDGMVAHDSQQQQQQQQQHANAVALLEFAESFNLGRLKRHCEEVLLLLEASNSRSKKGDEKSACDGDDSGWGLVHTGRYTGSLN